MKRCTWVDLKIPEYIKYHDEEWGIPVHSDKRLFEMLILEGAQAGLSWSTILAKRGEYKKAFDNFDFYKIASYDNKKIQDLMLNRGIIRNKLKILSSIKNARCFISIYEEFGSFDAYLWGFVNNIPIKNKFKKQEEVPAKTALSEKISNDLKKRGMSFVGPTIVYAFMQAVGVVDDHLVDCYKRKKAS